MIRPINRISAFALFVFYHNLCRVKAPWVVMSDACTAYQGRLACHSRASF